MISSFFKKPKAKTFHFKHRYYDPEKEKIENLKNGKTTKLKFKRNYSSKKQNTRLYRILFLLIILSLLAYNFITK